MMLSWGPEEGSMHTIITDFERTDRSLVERAGRTDVCLTGIYAGPRQTMHYGIKPLRPEWTFCGTAITARPSHSDDLLTAEVAIKLARSGDVLVIDAGDQTDCAAFGATMAGAAKEQGCAAVVVDGVALTGCYLREREGIPTFCRGLVAFTRGCDKPGSVNVPVHCGGVIVYPGDLVLGDEDGVVVVPRLAAAAVVQQSEERKRGTRAGRENTRPWRERTDAETRMRALGVTWR
ncbi:MAG: RraA family protein [Alphaproteobacteria bacterium]|nr:RraA family protein [Alphaproteobacteria bacterium]